MEKWQKDHAEDMKDLAQCLTVTPRREDVDKFIIRKAVDAAKSGCLVKIVSNDNFREYIGTVNDFHFSEDWVREHVRDLGAPGHTTRNKKLLGAPDHTICFTDWRRLALMLQSRAVAVPLQKTTWTSA